MAGEAFGRGSALGLVREATWGTPLSRTNWLQIFSCTLQERTENAYINHLSTGQADFSDEYNVRTPCSGDLEVPLLYEGFGLLLEAAMGAAPAEGGGGGPNYVHTFNRGTLFNGLTAELIRGTSGKSEIFSGVVIPSWSILFERGAVSRFTASLLAEKATATRSTAPTASFGGTVQARAMLAHHVGSITWGSAYPAQRIEISVDNKLERMEDLGSLYTGQPGMGGYGEVSIRATISHRSDALYNDYRSRTEQDLTFSATNGTQILAVTARNCRIRTAPSNIGGSGLITEEIEFAAKSDASDGALSFALTNTQATYGIN